MNMYRGFIEAVNFTKKWYSLGFTDDDLIELEKTLLINPKAGDVMEGTGGLRKVRFKFNNSGKSGWVRICYIDLEDKTIIYLIDVFAKNEKENLSKAERNEIKKLVTYIKENADF